MVHLSVLVSSPATSLGGVPSLRLRSGQAPGYRMASLRYWGMGRAGGDAVDTPSGSSAAEAGSSLLVVIGTAESRALPGVLRTLLFRARGAIVPSLRDLVHSLLVPNAALKRRSSTKPLADGEWSTFQFWFLLQLHHSGVSRPFGCAQGRLRAIAWRRFATGEWGGRLAMLSISALRPQRLKPVPLCLS